jgi:hypothetical protein
MSSYLIVAYQTAGGRPLRDAIEEIARRDSGATFTLLVPATRAQNLFTWTEGESTAVATETANRVAERLRASQIVVTDVTVGDPDPFVAAQKALDTDRDYAAILVSTFPVGLSRWLRMDLPRRLEKSTRLPVIHVVVDPEEFVAG